VGSGGSRPPRRPPQPEWREDGFGCDDSQIDYEEVIAALRDLEAVEVIVAIQFSDASLNPIAVLRGSLEANPDHGQRFEVGEATIVVRPEDLLDASWVEGLGEEVALRIDLQNVQITVSPGSDEMADPLG
jgi:hypothetical protein